MPDKPKLTAEQIEKALRATGRGPVEAILERRADLVKLSMEEVSKIGMMLERASGNACCSGVM